MKLETTIKVILTEEEKKAFELTADTLYKICQAVCDCDCCPLKRFCDGRFDCMETMTEISSELSH